MTYENTSKATLYGSAVATYNMTITSRTSQDLLCHEPGSKIHRGFKIFSLLRRMYESMELASDKIRLLARGRFPRSGMVKGINRSVDERGSDLLGNWSSSMIGQGERRKEGRKKGKKVLERKRRKKQVCTFLSLLT